MSFNASDSITGYSYVQVGQSNAPIEKLVIKITDGIDFTIDSLEFYGMLVYAKSVIIDAASATGSGTPVGDGVLNIKSAPQEGFDSLALNVLKPSEYTEDSEFKLIGGNLNLTSSSAFDGENKSSSQGINTDMSFIMGQQDEPHTQNAPALNIFTGQASANSIGIVSTGSKVEHYCGSINIHTAHAKSSSQGLVSGGNIKIGDVNHNVNP